MKDVKIDRIRNVAHLYGVKLGKLCEILGEKSNYFGKVERGLRRMNDDDIHKIADYLNVNYYYLTGESDIMITQVDGKKDVLIAFNYERFLECCQRKKVTVRYVESKAGLPQGMIETLKEESLDPPDNYIERIAVILDTTRGYLIGATDDPSVPFDDGTGIKIKVFGDVAAGIPIQQIENFDPDDSESWEEIDRRTAKNGTYFALRIKGDSMEPRMFEGDTVIVRHQNTAETGDCAIVAINGDTATCKRIRIDPNGIYLIPLNNKYDPKFFSNEEIESLPITILGKVVEVRGKL